MPRRLSSGMIKDTRPLLLVTSVLKYTHSPDGGWVIMCRSTCVELKNKPNMSMNTNNRYCWHQSACCCMWVTFSPAKVTMSRGPYMKRPVRTCWLSSVNTASFTRWLAVTFCPRHRKKDTHWNTVFVFTFILRQTCFFCRYGAYPYLHMSSFAEPLLSGFGGGEFRYFFPIKFQDAGVFMPHDLQGRFQWLISCSVTLKRTRSLPITH